MRTKALSQVLIDDARTRLLDGKRMRRIWIRANHVIYRTISKSELRHFIHTWNTVTHTYCAESNPRNFDSFLPLSLSQLSQTTLRERKDALFLDTFELLVGWRVNNLAALLIEKCEAGVIFHSLGEHGRSEAIFIGCMHIGTSSH